MNLLEEATFDHWIRRIKAGEFHAVLMALPSDTFIAPLRGIEGHEIYGLKDLSAHDKEKVRCGTILALRGAGVAGLCDKRRIPWLAGTSKHQQGLPSLLLLPEWSVIHDTADINKSTVFKGGLGSRWQEATELWGRCSLEGLPTFPDHEAAVHYPAVMNRELSFRLLMEATLSVTPESMVPAGYWSNVLVRKSLLRPGRHQLARDFRDPEIMMTRANHARPHVEKFVPVPHVGDLRNISASVLKLEWHLVVGRLARDIIDKFLDKHPDIVTHCLGAIGMEVSQQDVIEESILVGLRAELGALFTQAGVQLQAGFCYPCVNGDIGSSVCGSFLHGWAQEAQDPAAHTALWFLDGAPAGIDVPMELDGIMPAVVDEQDVTDSRDLYTDRFSFTNHGSLEDDADTMETFKELVDKKYLKRFNSYEECKEYLGAEPILNKFACLKKWKWVAATGSWKLKKRIIMDSNRSGVKAASRKSYKSVLPRVTDAVTSLLHALDDNSGNPGEDTEQFVIDATDAFWELGLHPLERRYFVGKIGDKYYVYLRTVQGSRGAPLSWATVFGLICRCVQSLFYMGGSSRRKTHFDSDMQVYVDDPWAAVSGDKPGRDRNIAVMILAWRLIGVRLAFSKARRGATIDWIGASLRVVNPDMIEATIMADRLDEVANLTKELGRSNVVSIAALRSYTGKTQSMASLLFTWRPFVAMLWAALYSPQSTTKAPPGCIWTSQIREPLCWIKSFFRSHGIGNLVRVFQVDAHFNRGMKVHDHNQDYR